ncbi:hypothetical protein PQX77_008251 [Marasmius sp. AFHP31]|nr:hypothetical protein PQX77_008310 [Marasmius sp. AFHP31]KAK1228757.1 hypothetical protein PQX77_008251 [Marasmius sp. AFHP31]
MSCHNELIDLTADDDEEELGIIPAQHTDPLYHRSQQFEQPHPQQRHDSFINMYPPPTSPSIFTPNQHPYHPPFAGPSTSSAFFPERQLAPRLPPPPSPSPRSSVDSNSKVIDLTGSPSPPPQARMHHPGPPSFEDLSPRHAVCIGQLHAQALVLYPHFYVLTDDPMVEEWVPVKMQHDHDPNKVPPDTIHLKSLPTRTPAGETLQSETFGFVDHKTARHLVALLARGVIRAEAKVRKGSPSHPVLPLLMLLFTPKGNIPTVGSHLYNNRLLLDHPTHSSDIYFLKDKPYHNPHNPPAGGHNRVPPAPPPQRWSTPAVASKSVEIQRNQVEDIFDGMENTNEVSETEPPPEICTTLYAHQKKALTFLLEREREKRTSNGNYPSLWTRQHNPLAQQTLWVHRVTGKEVYEEPKDSKGAILADDMGLGKTISCIALIAYTMTSARKFAATPLDSVSPPVGMEDAVDPSHFEGSVWGMPSTFPASAKEKAKAQRLQEKYEAEVARTSRIKVKSRATLIICPLSTISNWEDQMTEHWKGEVHVVGGSGGGAQSSCSGSTSATPRSGTPSANIAPSTSHISSSNGRDVKPAKSCRVREGPPLRIYIYHGNARRPDPNFLADFDVVMTTYSTLASEYSKQNRSITSQEGEEDGNNSAGVDSDDIELGDGGNRIIKIPKAKKNGVKRKKPCGSHPNEAASALQSVHWFRVVLDEAHSIKEIQTVGCRASCDLMADRRLCLTGTPVQNKLDDLFALIKFLRLTPLDDKNVWTESVGGPLKFGQAQGVVRLRNLMANISLRRTKESRAENGQKILALPPRRDELRYLDFDEQERKVYQQFFEQSKAEFTELSEQNKVMKNYVGILQRILRLRQICDHFELVEGKGVDGRVPGSSYEDLVAQIEKEGLDISRANAIFNLLREAATTQCVECGAELCLTPAEPNLDGLDADAPSTPGSKRPRKSRNPSSRTPTRPNSPTGALSTTTGIRAVMTKCQHLFCMACYQHSISPGWPEVSADTIRPCSVCQSLLYTADVQEIKPEVLSGDYTTTPGTSRKKQQKREKRPRPEGSSFQTSTKIKALLADLVQFSKANPHSQNYDPGAVEIQMVDDKGNALDESVVKTVVFSQWTSMLDKVEDALELAGIRYDRLDGTMKRDDRTRAMDALKYDPGCEVLLVSLKAGGVGLNLTAAQRVYLLDPYWNPAVENQAVDRIHRLGQTRPVNTVKFIIKGSIEHKLLEVQQKKTDLANLTLGGKGYTTKAEIMKRREEDLRHLFN